MTNNIIKWTSTRIESLGLFDLILPVGLVGTGNSPTVSITALVHGDEATGLLVLHKFIEEYVPNFQFQGTIRLVPVANPLAALTRTRVSLLDMLDMNRGGIGDPAGQATERLAHLLYELLRGSELVINFHEFEADSRLACVYTNSGSDKVRLRILKGILAFGADVVWSIPRPDEEELRPILSFDSMVAESGTPVFSIEFPRGDLVTPEMLDTCLSNLKYVLKESNVIRDDRTRPPISHHPKAVRRTPVYTQTMGIWKPKVELMSQVEQGEAIGTLSALPYFSEIVLQSPSNGLIIQTRPTEVVRPNDIVFAVGTPDNQLQSEIDGLR
jgi:predicted deacylase